MSLKSACPAEIEVKAAFSTPDCLPPFHMQALSHTVHVQQKLLSNHFKVSHCYTQQKRENISVKIDDFSVSLQLNRDHKSQHVPHI